MSAWTAPNLEQLEKKIEVHNKPRRAAPITVLSHTSATLERTRAEARAPTLSRSGSTDTPGVGTDVDELCLSSLRGTRVGGHEGERVVDKTDPRDAPRFLGAHGQPQRLLHGAASCVLRARWVLPLHTQGAAQTLSLSKNVNVSFASMVLATRLSWPRSDSLMTSATLHDNQRQQSVAVQSYAPILSGSGQPSLLPSMALLRSVSCGPRVSPRQADAAPSGRTRTSRTNCDSHSPMARRMWSFCGAEGVAECGVRVSGGEWRGETRHASPVSSRWALCSCSWASIGRTGSPFPSAPPNARTRRNCPRCAHFIRHTRRAAAAGGTPLCYRVALRGYGDVFRHASQLRQGQVDVCVYSGVRTPLRARETSERGTAGATHSSVQKPSPASCGGWGQRPRSRL
jgi:hypothetical protein